MIRTIPDESLEVIRRVCAEQGCTLVDMALRGTEHRLILDLFIDNRQGVTLDLCSAVHRLLLDEAETDKFLSDVYRLDVSSPGVDRPLTFNWQYDKHVGRTVCILLRDGTDRRGKLLEVTEDDVTIAPLRSKGRQRVLEEPLRIPFDLIVSSTVEVSVG
ncbi:MAG: ribosome maturation factor RimP [Candidatus Kapaibacterium sp.]